MSLSIAPASPQGQLVSFQLDVLACNVAIRDTVNEFLQFGLGRTAACCDVELAVALPERKVCRCALTA